MDGRIRIGSRWTLQGQLAASVEDGVNANGTADTAAVVDVTRADRHLTFVGRYLERSPHFAPRLGFIPRTDIRHAFQSTSYRWRPRSTRLLAFGPGLDGSVTWDYAGHRLDRQLNPHFGMEFGGATQLRVSVFDNRETFAGQAFELHAAQFQASSAWLTWLEVAGFVQRGTRINYAPATGLLPFIGHTRDGFARLTIRPGSRVALEQSYIFTRLESTAAADGVPYAGRVFSNHLVRTNLNVQVTRALSLRAILDYNRIVADRRLTSIEPGTHLNADGLATFQLNPWTALYIGYTTGLETGGEDSGGQLSLRRAAELSPTHHQLFAKASYLVRF